MSEVAEVMEQVLLGEGVVSSGVEMVLIPWGA